FTLPVILIDWPMPKTVVLTTPSMTRAWGSPRCSGAAGCATTVSTNKSSAAANQVARSRAFAAFENRELFWTKRSQRLIEWNNSYSTNSARRYLAIRKSKNETEARKVRHSQRARLLFVEKTA